MSILIKNGRVITAEQDYVADIHIDNGIIATIGSSLSPPADRIIEAAGKYVIPGGIDVHTHLDMPFGGSTSSDDFETGSRAAAFGGTTCFIDFAIQSKGQSMREALDSWRLKGEKSTLDYGLHMIVTDLPDSRLSEMDALVHEGVTSFKLFLAYPNALMVDDATIFKAMRRSADIGALVCMHAENGQVIDLLVRKAVAEGNKAPAYHAYTRPPAAEGEATGRAIALAEMAGSAVYIVHLTCNEALEKVAAARARGLPAYAETCPQYLLLSLDDIERPGFEGAKFVFSPPVREKWHQERLWEGLRQNTLQIVSTDHCPFNFAGQKELGKESFDKIPNGGPGIENRLQLMFHCGVRQKRISLNRWVELTSTAPARMFGLYSRKGTIAVGYDADVVVWDPSREHTISSQTHHMRVDYSMYEGVVVKGNAETVIAGGRIVVEDGRWKGAAGAGRFIKRDAFSAP